MGKREKHGTAVVVAAAVVGGEVEGVWERGSNTLPLLLLLLLLLARR
jgi:hypothetical protein